MRRINKIGRTARTTTAKTSERWTVGDWAQQFSAYGGLGAQRPVTTWNNERTEPIGNSFDGYVSAGYKANGVVFAVILARMMLFTEARFQWQQMRGGRPGDLFGTKALEILEKPWMNGTTGDLLAGMEQDVSLAGNAYVARRRIAGRTELRRLRPDWLDIVVGSPNGDPDDIDATVAGYRYFANGDRTSQPVVLLPEDVSHFAPVPDPTARFRGMSWLTPIVREIQADSAATTHKGKFFDNAATPNLAVSIKQPMAKSEFMDLVDAHDDNHVGADNAYRTMWLLGGAEPTVIGSDMRQLDFRATQGAGETRIAAAGGVPPVIVGLSEGLAQATYSNYGQARRKFADGWARPQWRAAAAALESIVPSPADARLWYDDRDIAFLQEDQKDAADILGRDASTIRSLVDAGYAPDSVVDAVSAGDLSRLVHTDLFSVQLQPPGLQAPTDSEGNN